MPKSILEEQREIPVADEFDVLVAGAGVAGSTAALAAARAGARTMLVERNGCLGGVATAGLMANIGNRYMDRNGKIAIHGISKEVLDRLAKRGGASEKWACREVPGCVVDSEQLKVLLIEMLKEAGVEVLTHTLAARPIVEDKAVTGAFIESKAGREAVLARAVVDTTGEADLAWQAGCPMRYADGSCSLEFKMAGVDLDGLYNHFKRHPETFPVGMDMVKGFAEFERNWVERGIFFFPHGGGSKWDLFQKAIEAGEFQKDYGGGFGLDACGLYGLRERDCVIVNSNFNMIYGNLKPGPEPLPNKRLSELELNSQQLCYYVADFMRAHIPGFGKAYIAQMATDLGIRTTRGIVGRFTLRDEHASSDKPVYFDDAVACSPARDNFQRAGEFFHDCTFDVPLGIMLPEDGTHLLVASGKSVSCQGQGLIRGMSTCMVCGQAAGVTAALSARDGCSVQQVEVRQVQKALLEQGVHLGPAERLRELSLA